MADQIRAGEFADDTGGGDVQFRPGGRREPGVSTRGQFVPGEAGGLAAVPRANEADGPDLDGTRADTACGLRGRRKFQIPSPKHQKNPKQQNPKSAAVTVAPWNRAFSICLGTTRPI